MLSTIELLIIIYVIYFVIKNKNIYLSNIKNHCNMKLISEQKEKLKKIVLECYRISLNRNHNGLNISKLSEESILSKIKKSIVVFDNLDENSEVYKSLLVTARNAVNELNESRHECWYKILIESFVTIPQEIKSKKSKLVVLFPDKKQKTIKEENNIIKFEGETEKIIPEGLTGSKLKKIIAEEKDFNSELENMSFEDNFDIFELEDDSTEDINDLIL